MQQPKPIILWVLAITLILTIPQGVAIGLHPPAAYQAPPTFAGRINHIIVLTFENHAFDNYFGGYCQVSGPYCPNTVRGTPAGLCEPVKLIHPNGTCVRPFNFTAVNLTIPASVPLLHDWITSHLAWNHGKMNDFYSAEFSGQTPFGRYNGSTAPLFWSLAEQYGLGDNFFSSTLSYSTPNHWFLLAGQAPWISELSGLVNVSDRKTYLSEAKNTTSIEDLTPSGLSWKYYDYALRPWSVARNLTGPFGYSAFDYWNPQAAKQESYSAALSGHFVANTQFFADAKAGNLPNLSWIVPYSKQSDHPTNNVTAAESYAASVVNAVESSPQWNHTALFITWDDYGGFFDHVAPPLLNGTPLSFRVPFIVVSPYTHPGVVVHNLGYFESLLHLMEWRNHLGCITVRDCYAPLPLAYFDFNSAPRAPMLFPTQASRWSYPMPIQPFDAIPQPLFFTADPQYTNDPNGTGPDSD